MHACVCVRACESGYAWPEPHTQLGAGLEFDLDIKAIISEMS